jgi:hypothetical protein
MTALTLALAATLSGIALHAVVMRFLSRRWQLRALPLLLLLAFAGVAASGVVGGGVGIRDCGVALVLTLSLGFAYALLLIGVIHDSPTLALVNTIDRYGDGGMPVADWDAFVLAHPFLRSRLDALLEAGELDEARGQLRLSGKAARLLSVGDAYRRLRGGAVTVSG